MTKESASCSKFYRDQHNDQSTTYLDRCVLVTEENRQDGGEYKQILVAEGVKVGVVGGLKLLHHQVQDIKGRGNEEEFHASVVDRVEFVDDINVSRQEDDAE